ncbi:MAG: SDR family NAD(P)-dependent oxidoreductase [Halioglobus sp.]|nr:SDR family NAD(P)-dependent oxidoreductase [Halioglobus sp.]
MTNSKSVLITGATRGLGASLAREFARRGYRLALTGRSREALDALAAELRGEAAAVTVEPLDVEAFDTIPAAIRNCAERLGGLDIVVINAGVGWPTPAGEGHADAIRKTIDINLTGAILTAEAAVELFREQGRGQVVGITSILAVRGLPQQSAYSATKAGFGRYLESLRCDTRNDGIAVTDLAPGFIDSDMSRSVPNRFFVTDTSKGTQIMADMIERQVRFRYVPRWPWSLLAQLLEWLPDRILTRI